MQPKQFRGMIFLCVSLLAVMACGQLSVGVITPTPEDQVGETPPARVLEPTAAPTSASDSEVETPTSIPYAPTEVPAETFPSMAYLSPDGNLWVLESGSQTPRQLTFDANRMGNDRTAVEYGHPQLSSDGILLAYSQEIGTPIDSGYDITSVLWVFNLENGDQQQILDSRPAGFAWKPGTHLLTYAIAVDGNYFITRGQPDSSLANGMRQFDLDNGETQELVAPERGYTLSGPNWSPNGRFLAFEEVFNMEGSGLFAYYDFQAQSFYAWDEPVGRVSWSPEGSLLTYAHHTYAASGDERLYLSQRHDEEQLIGPDYEGPSYATQPVFSPVGDQIAYLAFLGGPETQTATVMVLDLTSGETQSLGQFEGLWELAWTPDGRQLVFSFGPWETPQVVALSVADGSQTVLADGSQPTLAGR